MHFLRELVTRWRAQFEKVDGRRCGKTRRKAYGYRRSGTMSIKLIAALNGRVNSPSGNQPSTLKANAARHWLNLLPDIKTL